ncbi:Uma2 family endonuclease [Leptolyngbya sp. PL-A3]|uniref:Uma2 family endonuclease n=1 Tax=Leptolyngbya sp. PL-A3 TaxID=2933911 RepID=UPI0032973B41
MIANPKNQPMAPEAYLEWEAQQPLRYEYLNGMAYAMTGDTVPHNDIALNLYRTLYSHLRSIGCRVNVADVKVQVSNNGPYFYPDVIVSCHEQDQRARKLIQFPCLIIEILSPGTAGFDRGEKFRAYRRLHTLQEYVLVDSETRSVDCYRRNEHGKWELTAYPPDEDPDNGSDLEVHFISIDFRCPLSLIYENIDFPEPSPDLP